MEFDQITNIDKQLNTKITSHALLSQNRKLKINLVDPPSEFDPQAQQKPGHLSINENGCLSPSADPEWKDQLTFGATSGTFANRSNNQTQVVVGKTKEADCIYNSFYRPSNESAFVIGNDLAINQSKQIDQKANQNHQRQNQINPKDNLQVNLPAPMAASAVLSPRVSQLQVFATNQPTFQKDSQSILPSLRLQIPEQKRQLLKPDNSQSRQRQSESQFGQLKKTQDLDSFIDDKASRQGSNKQLMPNLNPASNILDDLLGLQQSNSLTFAAVKPQSRDPPKYFNQGQFYHKNSNDQFDQKQQVDLKLPQSSFLDQQFAKATQPTQQQTQKYPFDDFDLFHRLNEPQKDPKRTLLLPELIYHDSPGLKSPRANSDFEGIPNSLDRPAQDDKSQVSLFEEFSQNKFSQSKFPQPILQLPSPTQIGAGQFKQKAVQSRQGMMQPRSGKVIGNQTTNHYIINNVNLIGNQKPNQSDRAETQITKSQVEDQPVKISPYKLAQAQKLVNKALQGTSPAKQSPKLKNAQKQNATQKLDLNQGLESKLKNPVPNKRTWIQTQSRSMPSKVLQQKKRDLKARAKKRCKAVKARASRRGSKSDAGKNTPHGFTAGPTFIAKEVHYHHYYYYPYVIQGPAGPLWHGQQPFPAQSGPQWQSNHYYYHNYDSNGALNESQSDFKRDGHQEAAALNRLQYEGQLGMTKSKPTSRGSPLNAKGGRHPYNPYLPAVLPNQLGFKYYKKPVMLFKTEKVPKNSKARSLIGEPSKSEISSSSVVVLPSVIARELAMQSDYSKWRLEHVQRYLRKKHRRSFKPRISYDVRKTVADNRLRIKGRFIKKVDQKQIMQRIFGDKEDTDLDKEDTQLLNENIQFLIQSESDAIKRKKRAKLPLPTNPEEFESDKQSKVKKTTKPETPKKDKPRAKRTDQKLPPPPQLKPNKIEKVLPPPLIGTKVKRARVLKAPATFKQITQKQKDKSGTSELFKPFEHNKSKIALPTPVKSKQKSK